jgi:hypothetical protein
VRAIYLELIDIEWDEDGLDPVWLAKPYSFLCRAIGCHWRTFQAAWTILEPKYTLQEGLRMRSRMVQEALRIVSERSDASSNAAKSRWAKHATALPSDHIYNTSHNSTEETDTTTAAPTASPSAPLSPPADKAKKFDFASVYDAYPRKEGKTKGLARLRSQVTTPEAFEQLKRAVENYAAKVKAEGMDRQFVQHFSTWANDNWRDYIDDPHIVTRQNSARILPLSTSVSDETRARRKF